MRLTGKELDRLTIFTLAQLARRRRDRGRPLNAPEAAAIVVDEILEWAWDGLPRSEVIERAADVLTRDELMDGVPEIIGRIEVDALFPSGSTLIVIEEPFGPSMLADAPAPGAVVPAAGSITVNQGRPPITVTVESTADVPIEVGSHFHFFEANRLLRFDRKAAFGMRLDVAAGSSVRWMPGESHDVDLVPLVGRREAWGFGGLVDGPLDSTDAAAALDEAIRRGYEHEDPDDAP